VELGYSPELDLAPFNSPTFYLFYDQGAVWNRNSPIGERQSLASAGGGIRFSIGEANHIGLEVAKPLTRDTEYSDSRDLRFFLSFSTSF
jgi:hemolysin activation/secretion protein